MSVLPSVEDHFAAVVEALTEAGLLVTTEDTPPPGSGWQSAPGVGQYVAWVRVTDVSSAPPTGMVDGVRSHQKFLYHVEAVGASRAQANRTRDDVQAVMAAGVTVPGRRTVVTPYKEQPGQTVPDHDAQGRPVWRGWDQYRVWTAPLTLG